MLYHVCHLFLIWFGFRIFCTQHCRLYLIFWDNIINQLDLHFNIHQPETRQYLHSLTNRRGVLVCTVSVKQQANKEKEKKTNKTLTIS